MLQRLLLQARPLLCAGRGTELQHLSALCAHQPHQPNNEQLASNSATGSTGSSSSVVRWRLGARRGFATEELRVLWVAAACGRQPGRAPVGGLL